MTGDSPDTAILICGHGSRDPAAVAELARLAGRLAGRFGAWPVAHAYLEFARPVIGEGLDRLAAAGARRILAAPAMLFAAGHAKDDIPSVLNAWARRTPGVSVEYGRDLGLDPKMVRAAGVRIGEAVAAAGGDVPAHETLLLVVGRGTSDPDANGDVAKLTRLLWEGLGFGWAEAAYSGVTFPLVAPALARAARLGFRRIIVFPYFLFTGVLVGRIYEAADRAAARHPEIEIVKAGWLGDHPLVADTLAERVGEIPAGGAAMNCQGCKYRTQVLGFEGDVGRPQASHHHHVEGIGSGLPARIRSFASAEAGNGHAHPHPHPDRPAHPHAGHPLGPASLDEP